MKHFRLILIAAFFCATLATTQELTQPAQESQPVVTVPSGSRILLALKNSINTRRSRDGDGVYLECIEPVAAGGGVVIPAGTSFQGTVRSVQRPGKLKGRASLQLTVDRMIFRNGYVVDLNSTLKSASTDRQAVEGNDGTIRAESTITRDVLLTGTGAIGGGLAGGATGLLIGAAAGDAATGDRVGVGVGLVVGLTEALLARGQDVTLYPGTSIEIVLQRPIALEMARIPQGSPANYRAPQPPVRPSAEYRSRRPMLPIPGLPIPITTH